MIITISVPASTSNIGPGFDVLGIGLSLSMIITAKIDNDNEKTIETDALPSKLTITYNGDSAHTVPLDPSLNLITKTAITVANSCNARFPASMHLDIENPIPLGTFK
jgi:homoserine kinase